MAKFKVSYHGFVYLEAEDEDEAFDLYDCHVGIYEEKEVTEIEEVDDFAIDISY